MKLDIWYDSKRLMRIYNLTYRPPRSSQHNDGILTFLGIMPKLLEHLHKAKGFLNPLPPPPITMSSNFALLMLKVKLFH